MNAEDILKAKEREVAWRGIFFRLFSPLESHNIRFTQAPPRWKQSQLANPVVEDGPQLSPSSHTHTLARVSYHPQI